MKTELVLTCNPSRLHAFLNSENVLERKMLLERTVFRSFLNLPKVSTNSSLLKCLLMSWDESERGFKVGGKLVKFSPLDASLIFGLPTRDGLKVVDLSNKSGNTGEEFSLKEFLPTSDERGKEGKEIQCFEDAIKEMDISTEEGKQMCSKLLLLHLFATFLFPSKNGSLKRSLIPYVKDIENIDQCSWGLAVLEFLVQSLSEAKKRWSLDKSVYLAGCSYGLQVWAYEHIAFDTMFKSLYGRPFCGAVKIAEACFPRIICWKNDRMKTSLYQKIFEKLTYNFVSLHLTVSDIEKEEDVVKNASKTNEELLKDGIEQVYAEQQVIMEKVAALEALMGKGFDNSSTAGPSFREIESQMPVDVQEHVPVDVQEHVPVDVQEHGGGRHVNFIDEVQLRLFHRRSVFNARVPRDAIRAVFEENEASPIDHLPYSFRSRKRQ